MDSRKSQVAFGAEMGKCCSLGVCVYVQTCYRVQRSVEKGMVQDFEKLGSACEKKDKREKEKQPRADKVEFVDTKITT